MLLTRQELLAWLRSLDSDAENPERHNALWDGSRVATLAEQEGLLSAGPQGQIDLARLLGQLKEDRWIAWNWQQWPPGTRDADEPPARFLAGEHLSRIQEIRVLPDGYRVAAESSPSASASPPNTEQPRLEAEQEQLLFTLVEAPRDVPRDQRGDLRVRDAKAGDAADIAAVHVRSWQAAYRGILSDELLDGLSASEREASWAAILEDREERWLALVAARDDGALMGFCSVATPSQGAAVIVPLPCWPSSSQ